MVSYAVGYWLHMIYKVPLRSVFNQSLEVYYSENDFEQEDCIAVFCWR